MKRIGVILLFLVSAAWCSYGQSKARFADYEIVPKGERIAGVQLAYYNLFSTDSELLLLVNGLNAKASFYNLSPMVGYAYSKNHVIGARLSFSHAVASVDMAQLSLLNDGLEFDLSNVSGSVRMKSASIFHRTYVGLEELGRIGLFYDVDLGLSSNRLQYAMDSTPDDWSQSQKIKLSFNPGIVIFASSNISTHVSVSIAEASWNRTSYFRDGVETGSKNDFRTQARLNLMGISFGLNIHL